MYSEKERGFALTELVIAVTLGAVILAIQGPERSRGGLASNEKAAIDALRSIAGAQAQLVSSGAIDTDDDGVGDFGYLGELAGSAPLRVYDPVVMAPAIGDTPLFPPLLPLAFRESYFDQTGDNVVRLNGYFFKMFLPCVPILDEIRGVAETGPSGIGGATVAGLPDPDTCEELWCCYAWPEEVGVTGRRAFFVDQEGVVLQTANAGRAGNPVYDGLAPAGLPAFDAAYSIEPASPNGFTGMGAPLGNPPHRANDGNVWTPVRR